MFIGKQRSKVEWFDLISKSKCISSETETILQLVAISCADDSGWQRRVTDVASWSRVGRRGYFHPCEETQLQAEMGRRSGAQDPGPIVSKS